MPELKLTSHPKGLKFRRAGHTFYFGHSIGTAMMAAAHVAARWEELAAQGHRAWPPDELVSIMAAKSAILAGRPLPMMAPMAAPSSAPRPTPSTPSPGITLHQAIDLYVTHQQNRAAAGQIGAGGVREVRYRCQRLMQFLPNASLASIDSTALLNFAGIIARRPISKVTGIPLSTDRVACLLAELRRALDHADATSTWIAPRRWEKNLWINVAKLRTPEERRKAQSIQTFTIDQLCKICSKVSPRLKGWVVYALNTGSANGELASLRRWEIKDLDGEHPRIERERPKTGVKSVHNLWPETVAILKVLVEGKGEDELVFTAVNGEPLIGIHGMSRFDLVAQQWRRTLRYYKITPFLQFRYLRKTGAQMVRNIHDLQASEAYLAHAEHGISSYYTQESTEALQSAIMEMRRMLQPVFEAGILSVPLRVVGTPACTA